MSSISDQQKRRRCLWLFAALLPVALFAIVKERNSWRPKVIQLHLPDGMEMSWSPDNKMAIAFANGRVEVFNIVSQRILYLFLTREHTSAPLQLRFSPNGSQLAYADFDGIRLWNFQNHRLSRKIPGQLIACFDGLTIKGLELSPSKTGAYLTTWNTQTGQKINSVDFLKNSHCIPADINWSYSYLSFSPNARYLATVFSLNTDPKNKRNMPESGGLQIFDAQSGHLIKQLLLPEMRVGFPVFSPDSQQLAVLMDENKIG